MSPDDPKVEPSEGQASLTTKPLECVRVGGSQTPASLDWGRKGPANPITEPKVWEY